jgi:hypothetical protein
MSFIGLSVNGCRTLYYFPYKHKKERAKARLRAGLDTSDRKKVWPERLTLAGFATRLGLVDDIGAAATTHDLAVAVAFFQSFQRVNDFHRTSILVQIRKMKPDNSGGRPCLSSIKPR